MNNIQRLFIDIETSPILGWAYQKYEVNLLDQLRDWSLLSFCAQWNNEKPFVRTIKRPRNIWDFVSHPDNDKALIMELWNLLDKADVVIAHNGDRFDVRKINSRFLYYNLPPPSPYITVDTKKVAKRVADNTSNKADDLGEHWKLGRKLEHEGWGMWLKCMSGDPKAWKIEIAYNRQDVILLHRMFDRVLPWIKNLNLNMYTEKTACANCGQNDFESRGFYYTKTMKYGRRRCRPCGKWHRLPIGEKRIKPLTGV